MATVTDTTKTPVETTKTISPKPEIVPGISKEIINELSNEINNMLSFAIYNGITINTEVNTLIQNSSVDDLINAHNLLCKNIAPATPKSIEYTKKLYQQGKEKTLFSKLPLVRNLIFLALFFLAAFIITGLSPDVNNDSLDKGIMDNQGVSLLLNLGFLTAISGLGVLFYLLKSVSAAVKNGTLVPEDTIYYIALIVLGVIAGLISSEIIAFYQKDAQDINLFNKGLMALIGGFSSDAIFSILQGIIDRIKAIFIPSSSAS
ncbi:hypothetical protein [uncultured Aquimarina sp.]|uniref:hypothetical protein n=1 Tax=uncultured Aquimarina sp. TaxID=575652 RepID=UPI00262B13C4|nr:hypothetical protein [uncultured Aquimarina sp.]